MARVTLDRSCLRHRLLIQRRFDVDGLDARGQRQYEWRTIGTVRARIETLGGRELEFAHRIVANCTHRITTPYVRNISTGDRLLFPRKSIAFSISHIDNVEFQDVVLKLLAASTAE